MAGVAAAVRRRRRSRSTTAPAITAGSRWQLAAPVQLEAFYYDNRGDPEAITDDLQWGWGTRFLNLGARVDLGPRTRLIAQALTGTTEMGDRGEWAVTGSTPVSAPPILRLTHEIGRVALSGRVDLFDTRERGARWKPRRARRAGR